jgi:methylglutaconyl-CoA hydratase
MLNPEINHTQKRERKSMQYRNHDPSQDLVLYQVRDRVATITLNRPGKRNTLNPELVAALDEAITAASDDDAVKIILIRANGDVFCAGADLAVLRELRSASYEENLEDSRRLANMFFRIHDCPKVVIAAVHGHAIAGGCGLVTVCDLSIAQHGARLGYSETRIGFVPAIVARFLVRKTGITIAKRLLLSGELVDAAEAATLGLVTEAAAPENFEERIGYWTSTLLTKTSGEALSATKKLIHFVTDHSRDEAVRYAIETNALSRGTADCKKGIDTFLSGGKIVW